ncbi:hypothetical protein [Streptomyces reticuli]|uniref:hypothetical protein n=1 Tax=Streptomyces reticuli TaxID=1926 RepID=UPI00073DE36F|nr:hypothetical protein [Streptomyces sp. SID7810]CUW31757.1 hypothetical protein TUE45_06506 [Streptomyces reticuli]
MGRKIPFTAKICDTKTGATDTFIGTFADNGTTSPDRLEAEIRKSFADHIEVSDIQIARHPGR